MQIRNEAMENTKNALSFNKAHASTPKILPTDIASPAAGGAVRGSVRQYMPRIVEAIEAAWKMKHSQVDQSMMGIFSALLLAMGPAIISAFFKLFNLPGIFNIW